MVFSLYIQQFKSLPGLIIYQERPHNTEYLGESCVPSHPPKQQWKSTRSGAVL